MESIINALNIPDLKLLLDYHGAGSVKELCKKLHNVKGTMTDNEFTRLITTAIMDTDIPALKSIIDNTQLFTSMAEKQYHRAGPFTNKEIKDVLYRTILYKVLNEPTLYNPIIIKWILSKDDVPTEIFNDIGINDPLSYYITKHNLHTADKLRYEEEDLIRYMFSKSYIADKFNPSTSNIFRAHRFTNARLLKILVGKYPVLLNTVHGAETIGNIIFRNASEWPRINYEVLYYLLEIGFRPTRPAENLLGIILNKDILPLLKLYHKGGFVDLEEINNEDSLLSSKDVIKISPNAYEYILANGVNIDFTNLFYINNAILTTSFESVNYILEKYPETITLIDTGYVVDQPPSLDIIKLVLSKGLKLDISDITKVVAFASTTGQPRYQTNSTNQYTEISNYLQNLPDYTLLINLITAILYNNVQELTVLLQEHLDLVDTIPIEIILLSCSLDILKVYISAGHIFTLQEIESIKSGESPVNCHRDVLDEMISYIENIPEYKAALAIERAIEKKRTAPVITAENVELPDWGLICMHLNKTYKLDELEAIAARLGIVIPSDVQNRKRALCRELALDYEAFKGIAQTDRVHEYNCANDPILEDDYNLLPPDQVIRFTEDGRTYCFSREEFKGILDSGGTNPYTRNPLPESALQQYNGTRDPIREEVHKLRTRKFKQSSLASEQLSTLLLQISEVYPYLPIDAIKNLDINSISRLINFLRENTDYPHLRGIPMDDKTRALIEVLRLSSDYLREQDRSLAELGTALDTFMSEILPYQTEPEIQQGNDEAPAELFGGVPDTYYEDNEAPQYVPPDEEDYYYDSNDDAPAEPPEYYE